MADVVVNAMREVHEVTIVCGRPSYDPTERRPWRLWQTECLPSANQLKVRIIRVGSTGYALAMTDPPFQGIVGALVALLKRKPYVYNIRDLYPEMAVSGSIMRAGLLSRLWEALHRWALRRAARESVICYDMNERILARGV